MSLELLEVEAGEDCIEDVEKFKNQGNSEDFFDTCFPGAISSFDTQNNENSDANIGEEVLSILTSFGASKCGF